MQISQQKFVV